MLFLLEEVHTGWFFAVKFLNNPIRIMEIAPKSRESHMNGWKRMWVIGPRCHTMVTLPRISSVVGLHTSMFGLLSPCVIQPPVFSSF